MGVMYYDGPFTVVAQLAARVYEKHEIKYTSYGVINNSVLISEKLCE